MALKHNPIGVAIIGYGKFAANYLKNLTGKEFCKNVSVKYLCKRSPIIVDDIVEKSIKLFKTKIATDYKVVIDDPKVDLVIVTSSPDSHFEICKYALLKNKHIICEKPMVFSAAEADELYKLYLKLDDKVFIVNYIHLFNENWLLFKDQFAKMNLDTGLFRFGNKGPFTTTSPLWDYGSHDVAMTVDLIKEIPGILLTSMSITPAIPEDNSPHSIKTNFYAMRLTYSSIIDGKTKKEYSFGLCGGNSSEVRIRECWAFDKKINKFGQGEDINILKWEDDKKYNSLANMLKTCLDSIKAKQPLDNFRIALNTTIILEKLHQTCLKNES